MMEVEKAVMNLSEKKTKGKPYVLRNALVIFLCVVILIFLLFNWHCPL